MSSGFFQPVSGMDLPRFAGVPSFMRLPVMDLDHDRMADVDVGLIGVPWDSGTTNRPGPRHGPRQLRDASTIDGHSMSGDKRGRVRAQPNNGFGNFFRLAGATHRFGSDHFF